MSFADFTRQRIFEPLGMTRTSWRDDYGRIVKNRAMSYSGDGTVYRTVMPFENVHGNGGLLTTVGDLLKWNQNFVAPMPSAIKHSWPNRNVPAGSTTAEPMATR